MCERLRMNNSFYVILDVGYVGTIRRKDEKRRDHNASMIQWPTRPVTAAQQVKKPWNG